MKVIAAIPARYAASRFPGKLIADLHGKPVIQHTYENVHQSGLFDRVIIITDNSEIESVVLGFGGDVIRSQKDHQCGSDRIAEAIFDSDVDIVINVQGDEPFIHPDGLASLIEVFKSDTKKEIDLASLMIPISDEINNPNVVKVITDLYNRALYFSRSAIPHQRSKETHATVYKHVGVYAFRKSALIDFYEHAPTPLELAEQIEAIRYLEMGKTIQMIETQFEGVGIDAPEDLERAKKLIP
jgi:3-deoxy-manno-octulosonate cytidylyltransferase (CMP-KDO synthetase)